jgi:uncharacterized protein (TIGR03437 family)
VSGFYPKSYGGVQVTIDGLSMPLLYVSANQMNAVVPMGLTSGTAASIRITNGTTTTPGYPVWIDASAAQLFSPVLNQDGTINSQQNPAKSGTAVSLFGTGWQSSFAPLTDGQVATAAQDACVMDCGLVISSSFLVSEAYMLYEGSSPGTVEGVTQFNLLFAGFPNANGPFPISAYVYGTNSVSITQTIWVTP